MHAQYYNSHSRAHDFVYAPLRELEIARVDSHVAFNFRLTFNNHFNPCWKSIPRAWAGFIWDNGKREEIVQKLTTYASMFYSSCGIHHNKKLIDTTHISLVGFCLCKHRNTECVSFGVFHREIWSLIVCCPIRIKALPRSIALVLPLTICAVSSALAPPKMIDQLFFLS